MSVDPTERLSRFIFFNSHFRESTGRILYSAFIPPKNRNEVSVYRTSTIGEVEIWEIGKMVGENRGRPPKARGDLQTSVAFDNNLEVNPETSSHERHANIETFPADKIEQRRLATKLAQEATLELPA